MSFLTAYKRAAGAGSARRGADRHWAQTVSSAGLLVLVPLFVFTFGPMLGRPHEEVVAYYARPFPAIVAVLTLLVGFLHFRNGVRVLIEDYVQGLAREVAIIVMAWLSYAAAATGIFAIARLAL